MCYQSYDTKFLKIYPELSPTPLQLEEDLEQLKVLENGYKMKVFKKILPSFNFVQSILFSTHFLAKTDISGRDIVISICTD